jgi:hypothetical protein
MSDAEHIIYHGPLASVVTVSLADDVVTFHVSGSTGGADEYAFGMLLSDACKMAGDILTAEATK